MMKSEDNCLAKYNSFILEDTDKTTLKLLLSELVSLKEEIEQEVYTPDEKIDYFLQKCEDFFLKYSIFLRKGERLYIEESFLSFRKNIKKYNCEKRDFLNKIKDILSSIKNSQFIENKETSRISQKINELSFSFKNINLDEVYKYELGDSLYEFIEKKNSFYREQKLYELDQKIKNIFDDFFNKSIVNQSIVNELKKDIQNLDVSFDNDLFVDEVCKKICFTTFDKLLNEHEKRCISSYKEEIAKYLEEKRDYSLPLEELENLCSKYARLYKNVCCFSKKCKEMNYFISKYTNLIKVIEYKNKIKEFLKNKNIVSIFHFTKLSNLESILKYGILSRKKLEEENIPYVFNDNERYDCMKMATCCSISFPNYKLFYRFQQIYNNDNWVVIELSPNILVDLLCVFCKTNAAKKVITETNINSFREILNIKYLEELFKNTDDANREILQIPNNYPTDPQAEVLVLNSIDVKYINKIYCKNIEIIKKYRNNYAEYNFEIKMDLFGPRMDYQYWSEHGN